MAQENGTPSPTAVEGQTDRSGAKPTGKVERGKVIAKQAAEKIKGWWKSSPDHDAGTVIKQLSTDGEITKGSHKQDSEKTRDAKRRVGNRLNKGAKEYYAKHKDAVDTEQARITGGKDAEMSTVDKLNARALAIQNVKIAAGETLKSDVDAIRKDPTYGEVVNQRINARMDQVGRSLKPRELAQIRREVLKEKYRDAHPTPADQAKKQAEIDSAHTEAIAENARRDQAEQQRQKAEADARDAKLQVTGVKDIFDKKIDAAVDSGTKLTPDAIRTAQDEAITEYDVQQQALAEQQRAQREDAIKNAATSDEYKQILRQMLADPRNANLDQEGLDKLQETALNRAVIRIQANEQPAQQPATGQAETANPTTGGPDTGPINASETFATDIDLTPTEILLKAGMDPTSKEGQDLLALADASPEDAKSFAERVGGAMALAQELSAIMVKQGVSAEDAAKRANDMVFGDMARQLQKDLDAAGSAGGEPKLIWRMLQGLLIAMGYMAKAVVEGEGQVVADSLTP